MGEKAPARRSRRQSAPAPAKSNAPARSKRKSTGTSKAAPKATKKATPKKKPARKSMPKKLTGTKRKRSESEKQSRKKDPTYQPPAKKRVAVQEEVMWDGWEQIYLVGTEWENYDSVYEYNWNFDHLEEDLKNPDGLFQKSPNTPYLFGCTEPQLLTVDETTGAQQVVCVPVIIAVDSKLHPPSEVAITSVQRDAEDLTPMRKMKMDWVPYVSKEDRDMSLNKVKPIAFMLECSQRREQVAKMSIDKLKEYEYALPFLFIPRLNETMPEVDSEVAVLDTIEGVGVSFSFDWKFDEIDDFVDDLVKQYDFKGDHKEALKTLINDKVKQAKDAIRAERKKIRDRLASIPEDMKESLNSMKCYKYYPKNEITNFGQTGFINRYYGHAAEIFPNRVQKQPHEYVLTEVPVLRGD